MSARARRGDRVQLNRYLGGAVPPVPVLGTCQTSGVYDADVLWDDDGWVTREIHDNLTVLSGAAP